MIGVASALDPAGLGAERIATLFWWMVAGAVVIWLAVVVLTLYALHRPHQHTERTATLLIVGGGFVAPTIILTGLLIVALALLPELLAAPSSDALKISISGEQWWWRVRYRLPNGEQVELANEIRIPLGEPVEVVLESPDVIHAFWVPSLAGKVDMIPGRVNRLTLEPTRTGVFRGVCAEYCGTSHAFMALDAVVLEKEAFRDWLERQQQPAHETRQARGRELFLANGCGACHAIRGTAARGVIGPDLTHVGSRHRIGAGILKTNRRELARWIADTGTLKPGVHMPAFGMLAPEEIEAIAAYLEELR
jgi:cytochrome c oxidase subunit II